MPNIMDLQLTPSAGMPERQSANVANQAARGVGLAPRAPAQPMPQRDQPLIDYKQNPFGAAGLVLSSAAAGMRGQESPVAQLEQQRMRQRQQEMQQQEMQQRQAELNLNIVEKYLPILAKTPAKDRPAVIQHAGQIFASALGGQEFIVDSLTHWSQGDIAQNLAKVQALKAAGAPAAIIDLAATDTSIADKWLDRYGQKSADTTVAGPETETIDLGGTKQIIEKGTGKTVKSFDVTPKPKDPNDPTFRSQQASAFLLEDGRHVASRFNPNAAGGGSFEFQDTDGKWKTVPPDAQPVTLGTGGFLNNQQYLKAQQDFNGEVTGLKRLNTYAQKVGDLNVGISRWADQVAIKAKTLLGNEASRKEIDAQVAQGQLQGLLGLFRTDIVGPGVMTEYDAQRVIQAVGGDVTALQNPEVVKELLSGVYESKLRRAKIFMNTVNRNSKVFGDEPVTLGVPETLQSGNLGKGEKDDRAAADAILKKAK